MINYLKVYEDGTKEATKFKPLFGVKESDLVEKSTEPLGDMQVNNIWLEPSNTLAGELAKETTLDFFGDGSCIATYNLNGNANDLSGNYNGTATNVTYSDGKFGQCALLNGSTEVLTFPSSLLSGLTNVTLSGWFNLSLHNIGDFILRNISGSNTYYIGFRNINGFFSYNGGLDGSFGNQVVSDERVVNNEWVHLAISIENNTTVYFFVNGILKGSCPLGFSISNISANFSFLGANAGRVGSGSIDQLRIFNRALTEAEVQELYYTYSQTYTPYISQPTYLSQNGKLLEVEVNNGVPSTLQANEDAPKIVEECIQVSKVIQTGNRKIIELGTIFNNNRYVVDNPFGNENYEDCDVKVEVFYNGVWNETGWYSDGAADSAGTSSGSTLEGIVIVAGKTHVCTSYNIAGGTGSFIASVVSAPARVIVTYVGEAK